MAALLRAAPRLGSGRAISILRPWDHQQTARFSVRAQDALKKLLLERQAVKAFASDPVPDPTLAEILRLTQVSTDQAAHRRMHTITCLRVGVVSLP